MKKIIEYILTALSVLYFIQTLDRSVKHLRITRQPMNATLHEQTNIRWIQFFRNKLKIFKVFKNLETVERIALVTIFSFHPRKSDHI
jgi:hypothetical protein